MVILLKNTNITLLYYNTLYYYIIKKKVDVAIKKWLK